MSDFEGILRVSGLAFGACGAPEAPRPGASPERFEDFRHDPELRRSLLSISSDDVYTQWLERARYVAERARLAVEAGETSATALARLAHAYLAADDPYQAAPVATEALDGVIQSVAQSGLPASQESSFDVSAAVAAAWALILAGQSRLAEGRLSQLPANLPIALIRATIAADAGKYEDAIRFLSIHESPEVEFLRGYALLRLDRPQEAIHELRKAISAGAMSADGCATMASAFWRLGSRRKAINFARQAARLAPGRKDISLALIDYLTNSYRLEAAESEIQSVLRSGVEDEPELVIRLARIKALSGDTARCIALMRRAEGMAKASEDMKLVSFVAGQLALLEYGTHRIDRAEGLRRIRKLMREHPEDLSLAIAFSALCVRATMLKELRNVYDRHKVRASESQLRPLALRIAYLEGRFEDLAQIAEEWSRDEPLNSSAADLAMLWSSYVSLDWDAAARRGASLLQRFPYDGSLANNVAYVSVLAGRLGVAERALRDIVSKSKIKSYVILATQGLVKIAKGQIQDGLRDYRQAAELAERDADGQVSRAEVIIAQGLALRLNGAFSEVSSSMRAGALPAVSLPSDWPDIPELRLMQWLCERTGSEWPPFIA